MKNPFILLLAALATPAAVQALPIHADADFFGTPTAPEVGLPPSGMLLTAGDPPLVGTFDFTNPDGTTAFSITNPYPTHFHSTFASILGFDPLLETAVDGFVAFFFRDPNGGDETTTVAVTPNLNLASNGSGYSTFLVLGAGMTADVLLDINADGMVNYTINATSGEFVVDAAYAQIRVEQRRVPEGGSALALLGLGLIGVDRLRQRLARKA